MITVPDKKICLRAMQITADEQLLNLQNIMELTVKNYGCDVVLVVNSIEFPLHEGEEVSVPSGAGRVYGDTEIKVKKTGERTQTTFYRHPEVNNNEWNANRDAVFPPYYKDQIERVEVYKELLNQTAQELVRLDNINHYPGEGIFGIREFLGFEESQCVWLNPRAFGIEVDFNLNLDLNEIMHRLRTLFPTNASWLQSMFDISNPSSIASKLAAAPNVNIGSLLEPVFITAREQFDRITGGLVGRVLSDFANNRIEYDGWAARHGDYLIRIKEAETYISTWNKAVESETRYYEKQVTENGVVDVQISKEQFFKPVNVKLLYTIEEVG